MAFMQVSRKVDYTLRAVIHLADDEHQLAWRLTQSLD